MGGRREGDWEIYARLSAAVGLGSFGIFPAARRYVDRLTGLIRRHNPDSSVVARALHDGVRRCGFAERVLCHTFRHSFETRLRESASDIRTVQELLGHSSVRTKMILSACRWPRRDAGAKSSGRVKTRGCSH